MRDLHLVAEGFTFDCSIYQDKIQSLKTANLQFSNNAILHFKTSSSRKPLMLDFGQSFYNDSDIFYYSITAIMANLTICPLRPDSRWPIACNKIWWIKFVKLHLLICICWIACVKLYLIICICQNLVVKLHLLVYLCFIVICPFAHMGSFTQPLRFFAAAQENKDLRSPCRGPSSLLTNIFCVDP